jgi:plasmid stabilization system protein ParE
LLANKFELAAGGTLFLDAVHALPAELHAVLLGILQRRERGAEVAVGRVGSDPEPGAAAARAAATADARVIASTTRDMARDAHSGRLDPLFRFLSRNRIAVPALADRREDIPALVQHFVQRISRRLEKPIRIVSPVSMTRLEAYLWPGNIDELRSVLERAILVARGNVLDIDADLLDEGLTVGSYRLVSQLGSGGMGEVWLGKHRLLARPAAVKLIRNDQEHGTRREALVRRFQREAQVTAGLRSPHTVQLYDFGVNDTGSFYYVMELLTGLDLQRMITRFGPQPAERVVVLLRQACRSLGEAHEHGLVHRDIKPANLFVTCLGSEYDYLKVVDFGIVKDRPEHEATHLSAQNVLQGTPAFMCPEIILGNTPIDGRADLYSLACSAYFALTGQLLFPVSSPTQMLVEHTRTSPAPPSQVTELLIPPELEATLMRCLEKEPKRRPASALELDAQLARVPFAKPWTQDDAREWWEVHAPEVLTKG